MWSKVENRARRSVILIGCSERNFVKFGRAARPRWAPTSCPGIAFQFRFSCTTSEVTPWLVEVLEVIDLKQNAIRTAHTSLTPFSLFSLFDCFQSSIFQSSSVSAKAGGGNWFMKAQAVSGRNPWDVLALEPENSLFSKLKQTRARDVLSAGDVRTCVQSSIICLNIYLWPYLPCELGMGRSFTIITHSYLTVLKFLGVVAITSPLHGEGREFNPPRNLRFVLSHLTTLSFWCSWGFLFANMFTATIYHWTRYRWS